MTTQTVLNEFIRTFSGHYRYTTTVRHKGTVIAFAMDDRQRIYYTVLDLVGDTRKDSAETTNTQDSRDLTAWQDPKPLMFPNEIAEVGFGVADQLKLPVFRMGSTMPERPGTVLQATETDPFLSTTARLTADAPFQVLSDGQHVYVFRQAIANPATATDPATQVALRKQMVFVDEAGTILTSRDGDAGNLGYVNREGDFVTSTASTGVPIVNSTLLVDRFVLSGNQLQTKMEVRFQRSRSKTRPQSRKDSLGAKDLDGNNFLEPTQELKFVGNLNNGRFTVLLLPTRIADLQRWQFFVHNSITESIDVYDVERSPDGLFNTRGSQVYTCTDHPDVFAHAGGTCVEPSLADPTLPCDKELIPRMVTEGYAESALKTKTTEDLNQELAHELEHRGRLELAEQGTFATITEPHITLAPGVKLGQAFTQEAWIFPIPNGTAPQALITNKSHVSIDSLEASRVDPLACPSVWIEAGSRVRVGFGDGSQWNEWGTRAILSPNTWNHLAITFDGKAYRFYVNGRLRERTEVVNTYVNGTLQTSQNADGSPEPMQVAIHGRTLPDTAITCFGAAKHSFSGIIDEIRLWNRVRLESELVSGLHYRLLGQESHLQGYWRFDEADGATVYDQTNGKVNGTLQGRMQWNVTPMDEPAMTLEFHAWQWVTSDAPIGESLGVSRSSFRLASTTSSGQLESRHIESGLSALLYYQQEKVASGYAGEEKPLKRNARVMLAVATKSATGDKSEIATLDIGVSGSGKLAQIPDRVALPVIHKLGANGQSINQQLDRISSLQGQSRILKEKIVNLNQDIARLTPTLTILDDAIATHTFGQSILDPEFSHLNEPLAQFRRAAEVLGAASVKLKELNEAEAIFYEHDAFQGVSFSHKIGRIPSLNIDATHQFAHKISSVKVPEQLQVTLFSAENLSGDTVALKQDTEALGAFNDRAVSAKIVASPAYQNANVEFDGAVNKLNQQKPPLVSVIVILQDQVNSYLRERQEKTTQLATVQAELDSLEAALKHGVEVPMSLIHTDPFGLTLSGGLLGFAWTKDTPLLFDSATGSLALYFRGVDDQFFVTYYDTLTERAKCPLADQTGIDRVVCIARSTDLEMDDIAIAIRGATQADTCTVVISGAGIEETWTNVPRQPKQFAAVLNGQIGERVFVGQGAIATELGHAKSLNFPDGVQRSLPANATLMVGNTRVILQQAVSKGATQLVITSDVIPLPTGQFPIFYLEYDYAIHATTTKVPNDLYNGSLLIRAVVVNDETGDESTRMQVGQRVTSGATLTCKWTAAVPGSTLTFDGVDDHAHLATTNKLRQFEALRDLTIETWVRPNRITNKSRLVQYHQSDRSNYALGLQARPLMSAIELDGSSAIALNEGVVLGPVFTQEVWIYPTSNDDKFQGILGNPATSSELRSPSLWIFGKNRIHAGFGDGQNWNAFLTDENPSTPILALNSWNHIAVTFDGTLYRVYVNGNLRYETNAFAGKIPLNTPVKFIGRADNFFKGRIDDVRLWKRARTQIEIQADMNRQLSGTETDLVGYWHFENRSAIDYSRSKQNGTLPEAFEIVASPLSAYSIFAGVNHQFVQTDDVFASGNWAHLATAFKQSYGLEFDGLGGYVDCGNDPTLNIDRDLTIEISLQVKDLKRGNGVLSRGRLTDGTSEHDVPYAVHIAESGHIVFMFEDVDHQVHAFVSSSRLDTKFHKIAITRKREKEDKKVESDNNVLVKVNAWDDIRFYIDGQEAGFAKYESTQSEADDFRQPKDVGTSSLPLEIGLGTVAITTLLSRLPLPVTFAPFRGIISEVRIWNVARDRTHISQEVKGNEKGLVSWWQFQESDGNTAFDSKSRNHATLKGNIQWVKDPNPDGSKLTIYHNGKPVAAKTVTPTVHATTTAQFTLGACQQGSTDFREHLQGELEELRIWNTTRTLEQIQDNVFRRLMGEQESLIAYYTFDPEVTSDRATPAQTTLFDQSSHGQHLQLNGASYLLSTAPVGEDTPQARSALAGVRTPFHDVIQSQPSIEEYGDLQYDSNGNLIGVFKRCYSFIKDGAWQLITGFKVGDLVTEWIGQVQTAPQLIGYIEGAPPVPSENLTATGYVVGEFADYTGASSVELTQAQSKTYTYSVSKDRGFDMSADVKVGGVLGARAYGGFGLVVKSVDVENVFGVHGNFEQSLGWLEDASTGVGRTTTEATKMELRGIVENADAIAYPKMGRRFVPDNLGMALVKSETADVFALRLKHNQALVSFQMRPNPDIPPDRNIITFPMNPRYVKQGTLDGKVGFETDNDYPNALTYSPDSSYFKPIEAYALKDRINRQEAELQTFFEQYDARKKGHRENATHFTAGDLADGRALEKLPRLQKRNLVNSYVWTAGGGLYAETQETMDTYQEQLGGSYAFKGMAGIYTDLTLAIGPAGIKFELDAMFGGHLNLTVTKSQESETAFGLNVDLGKVESDIYLRNAAGELIMDHPDPRQAKPKLMPGRVDAYRFMTFYLEPRSDHFDLFFNRVVDPIWLEQSDDPGAVALREAEKNSNGSWRIMHRVTYVSRVLPPLSDAAPSSLEKALQTLDIDSNYQLIQQLEPFVSNKLTSFVDFSDAIREALKLYLPELVPHTPAVIQYMSLYYGIVDLQELRQPDALGQGSDRLLNQPPIVNAGTDHIIGLDGLSHTLDLEGSVIDDRLARAEDVFVTWEQLSGEGTVEFANIHALKTQATFSQRGRYLLRLTAHDGLTSASDTVTIVVNQRPVMFAGADQQVKPRLVEGEPTPVLMTQLLGELIDSGLGDPERGVVTVKWSQQSKAGKATFAQDKSLQTPVVFHQSGNYLLKLTVDNGSFTVDDEVMIAVAARATEGLQALYTFEAAGDRIPDVSGVGAPLNLSISDPQAVHWLPGRLAIKEPTLLATPRAATRLTRAIKATNEVTLEAWLNPYVDNHAGLARILTLSNGPGQRSFTLGQSGNHFYAGIRTTTTDANASTKALMAGTVNAQQLTHVVCTRSATGTLRFYINGDEMTHREVEGSLSGWDEQFQLAFGNELGGTNRSDRAWRGELHLVAVYNRALTLDEVKQNYDFGANTNLPPVISAGVDQVMDWVDTQLPITTQIQGTTIHDRPAPQASVNWAQVGGPGAPNGVKFVDETALETTATFPHYGRYTLRLTVDDGELMSSDEVTIVVHQPPAIATQVAPHVALVGNSATIALKGLIHSTGLGEPSGSITSTWRQVSGPNTLAIANPNQLETTATVTQRGVYGLELTVNNGRLSKTSFVTVTVSQRPRITVGSVAPVTLAAPTTGAGLPKAEVTLIGTIVDAGSANAQPSHLRLQWEQVSGPGTAAIASPHQLNPTATFTVGGLYVLRLTATHREIPSLSHRAEVTITVNRRPVVMAGPDQVITLPAQAELDGVVSDDGLPTPSALTLQWAKVSGPGTVNFSAETSSFTTASFSIAGTYVLRLTANDGVAQASDEVVITVKAPPRITHNLTALYTFREKQGQTIQDVSGVAPALPLTFSQGARLTGNALVIDSPTIVESTAVATKIIERCKASNAIAIEAWIKPKQVNPTQELPARIVTLSANDRVRAFTLGQDSNAYLVRLRTTAGDTNGAATAFPIRRVQTDRVTHLLYTWDKASNVAKFYMNGILVDSKAVTGDFTHWGTDHKLALANEFANQPRAWLGEYYLVALYDRALSEEEVRQNYAAGF